MEGNDTMTLDAALYSFSMILTRTTVPKKIAYVSPSSRREDGIVSECLEPDYDPFEGDCPNVRRRAHPKPSPAPEIRCTRLWGRKSGDLLWGMGAEGTVYLLIKEAHVPPLESHGVTGVEFRPVDLYRDRAGAKPLLGYVEMRTTARVPIDLERSGVSVAYACPFCDYRRYSTWDGEKGLHLVGDPEEWPDVFMPEQPVLTTFFVKCRFAQLMVDSNLRPMMLMRLEDMEPYRLPS